MPSEKQITLFWFRRDLRLNDNAGLFRALKNEENIQPVFIFDRNILDKLEDKDDRRVSFIYAQIERLKAELEKLGSTLWVFYGRPLDIYTELIQRHSIKAIYANRDYEPYARERDKAVYDLLVEKGIPFRAFKDQVIFEKDEVLKDDGKPYTVYTPYSKRWKAKLNDFYIKPYPAEKYFDRLNQCEPADLISLGAIGFERHENDWPSTYVKTDIIKTYDRTRDIPSIEGTSRLSVHLRFGTVSIRHLIQVAINYNEKWLNELIWRDFYQSILWHFPHVVGNSFRPEYDRIEWRNDEDQFQKWCDGQTGYPIVDAGMRELNATGYMHNRVRMVVASFLCKHLLIDWRWGETYFARKLLDFDLASNNGGWQWAAGCGVDAAPYFRVFNPYLQAEKFDPNQEYIKHWVPEVGTKDYPEPIIEHSSARNLAIETYKTALK